MEDGDGEEYNGEDDEDLDQDNADDGRDDHLGVGKGTGERPAKVLHGKGANRRGRPGDNLDIETCKAECHCCRLE